MCAWREATGHRQSILTVLLHSVLCVCSSCLSCGLGGTFFGGWAMDWRGGSKGIFAVISALELCCFFTTLAIVFALAAVMALDLTTSMVCLALADFFLFATGAPINASLLSVAPKNMRSLAMAMSILLMHALGDLPSPFLMGVITDQVGSIRLALMCLCLWLLWTVLFWGLGVWLARGRAQAFKVQLAHDMSLPASERSALLRRGSTGSFLTSDPGFLDSLQARPSMHRPFQYYDSDDTAHQPYPQHAFLPTNIPAAAPTRVVRKARSVDRTPPQRQRAVFQARSRPMHYETQSTMVHGLPIYDSTGRIVGYAQSGLPSPHQQPAAAPYSYQDTHHYAHVDTAEYPQEAAQDSAVHAQQATPPPLKQLP
jgi:hypothetical protein